MRSPHTPQGKTPSGGHAVSRLWALGRAIGRAAVPARWRTDQRGSLAVEMVIIVPGLMILLALMIAGGRLWFARSTVTKAAYSAARAGSLARTPGQASAAGQQAAIDQLNTRGLNCLDREVSVDTSGFGVPVGQPAAVRGQVDCRVGFADLVLPGMPGSIVVHADAQSTLDSYRQR